MKIYVLKASDGEYAIFNDTTYNYSWWNENLDKCWNYYYAHKLDTSYTVSQIMSNYTSYYNHSVEIIKEYTPETHPEMFI